MIKQSGMAVTETSYYGSLEALFNKIGSTLKPFVRAIINTKNIGSGIPDGGLFTKDQFSKKHEIIDDFIGTPPSRGVIEIKGTSAKIKTTAKSEQVKKYLKGYGQVLVTNYYQFLLLVLDENEEAKFLESYNLAQNENEFWQLASDPRKLASIHEERLTQYLLRVMLHAAPLTEPKDVAWFIASYARDARIQIEQLDLPALDNVKNALEEALGVSFSGAKGEHFFKSTLIQTIFYGVFSAWILYYKDKTANSSKFDWRLAGWYLKVPMIRALFHRVANPSQLGRLGLIEVLDWTADTLNRIEKGIFFNKFEESEAVLYFYEPFLEAFDKELRKNLGVWYTPKEIVQYMVEKVDRTLRRELHIKRGLADENVYVLDPACGTGAYLVEVLKRIYKTLKDEGTDALTAEDLKGAAMTRIFGFEILPAPFVVSHLQLGILLQNLGANFIHETDRVGVYLTNALTGWEPPKEEGKQLVAFPEMQEERDAAELVKRDVLGPHLRLQDLAVNARYINQFKQARFNFRVRRCQELKQEVDEEKIKRGININLKDLRATFNYAARSGLIPEHFVPKFPKFKTQKKTYEILEDTEIIKILQSLDASAGNSDRTLDKGDAWLAYIVIRETGARRGAIARRRWHHQNGLKWKHINWMRNTITLTSKGKAYTLPMTDLLRETLIKRKSEVGDKIHPEAFVIRYIADTLTTYFRRAMKKAGVKKPGAVHILRHTLPVELLEAGANIIEVRDWLNHANLSTTNIYSHITNERLQKVAKIRNKSV